MSPMMRVRLAFVFVVVAALFTATRAVAGQGYGKPTTYNWRLSPMAADEPDASGVAHVLLYQAGALSRASGPVTCKGLVPNAAYVVLIDGVRLDYGPAPWTYDYYFTTDTRGSGGINFQVPCALYGPRFRVYNAVTNELVLQ